MTSSDKPGLASKGIRLNVEDQMTLDFFVANRYTAVLPRLS